MVQLGDELDVSENHPLAAEISSLRLAVARFQDEAHSSSVKLQRHSLDKTNVQDRVLQLERENDALKSEIAILRANPHPDASPQAHPAVLQVQQLTLSLRRLSDKLSLTEDALLARTTELTHAIGEATKAKLAAEGAYELAARTRGREEAGKVREAELEWKVKAAEEAAKMSDLVVNEYADLVRALNARAGQGPTKQSRSNSTSSAFEIEEGTTTSIGMTTLAENLSQGKLGLQRLLAEFSGETGKLQTELFRLHGEVDIAEAKCEAERKSSEQCRVELANARFELQRLKLDDNAAAKMVSRYMKFSQKSTDTLQDAMTALKTRHSATTTTLSAQLYDVSLQLRSSEVNVERLRSALDELGADILKETYGRRREVALRIRMVNREEKIREDLERWLLRAEETLERDGEAGLAVHQKMVHSARELLSSLLDGPSSSSSTSKGSLARLILATSAVEELSKELEIETTKRLHLERLLSHIDKFSSTTSEQDTIGDNSNAAANAVEPTVVSMSEGKDRAQLSLDGPSINSDPPLPIGMASWTQTDKTDQHLHKGTSPSNQSPDRDQTSQVNAEEPSTTIYDVAQTVMQEASSAPEPMIITFRDRSPPVQISAEQDSSNEIIADTEPSTPIPTIDQTNHDPIPPTIPEQHVPETHTPQMEDTEELISLPNPPLATTSDYQSLISFPSEGTPSDDAPPSTELFRTPPNEFTPLAEARESSSEESDSSPAKPVLSEFVPSHLLNLPEREPHPLLADLVDVGHRYDDLQRAFRDCHLALEALKASMPSTSPPTSASHPSRNGVASPDILQTALERLNDYTEDARVELEIRIADERLMARGFETLLSVPGALSSPSIPSRLLPHESMEGLEPAPTQSEVERQIEAFISGTDPAVEKALHNLSRKLDDIQHDIAALKRAAHDPVLSPTIPSTAPVANGGGWSSWIRNAPSLPASPASGLGSSPGPAPTFGNVMTTPRLRHSPSLNFQAQSEKGYLGGGSKDAFAALGLKVPMPSYVHTPQTPQRSRTVSTMYMLGLGARRPSASGSFTSPTQHSKKPPPRLHLASGAETDDISEPDDADVE